MRRGPTTSAPVPPGRAEAETLFLTVARLTTVSPTKIELSTVALPTVSSTEAPVVGKSEVPQAPSTPQGQTPSHYGLRYRLCN